MAHFRGTMTGNRGTASRLSSKDAGMLASVYGWDGAVTVRLSHRAGRDHAVVTLWPGPNMKAGPSIVLYDGPIDTQGRAAASNNHGG